MGKIFRKSNAEGFLEALFLSSGILEFSFWKVGIQNFHFRKFGIQEFPFPEILRKEFLFWILPLELQKIKSTLWGLQKIKDFSG